MALVESLPLGMADPPEAEKANPLEQRFYILPRPSLLNVFLK